MQKVPPYKQVLPDMQGLKRVQGWPDHLGLPKEPKEHHVLPLQISFQSVVGILREIFKGHNNQEKRWERDIGNI